MKPEALEIVKVAAQVAAGVLIPLVIFLVGNRFNRQRERADAQQRHLAQISSLSDALASDNRKKRLIALQILGHLRISNQLPAELVTTVGAIAVGDDPEVAGVALVLLGGTKNIPESLVLLEVLAPLKVHLERTRNAFEHWRGFNESLENEIMERNKRMRDLLISKFFLIPTDLREDAEKLVAHFDAWLDEYQAVRPGGVRDKDKPFVFVGPKGMPFPSDSERRVLDRYDELMAKYLSR
jgi:hypothetical protein